MAVQQPLFTIPEEHSFQLLSNLPFCPSKDLIALEDRYLRSLVHTLPGYDENDNDSEVVEKFTLDGSYFGRTQTILRDRDPKAIFNIRLSSNLPFPSEHDFPDPFRVAERVPYDLRRKYNLVRINVRLQARESVRNCMKYRNISLARLFQLPHEVFLEILSHAHPIDLHALRAVNRELRIFFSSTASNVTWRKYFARSSAPTTPDCPTDVNGWEWATLFFGAPHCDICQKQSIVGVNPDVIFRKRLCISCLYERARPPRQIVFREIEQMKLVHDLVLKTIIRPIPDTEPDCVVMADFEDVIQRYLRLQDDVENGVDGAKEELKHYQTIRRAYVEPQLKLARECNEWLLEVDRYYRNTLPL